MGAIPQRNDARTKSPTPYIKVLFRPNLSAMPPAGIKVVAYTIVYAFITQEMLTGFDCGKLAAILLNAAYRIVESMETRKVARLAIPNIGQGFAGVR